MVHLLAEINCRYATTSGPENRSAMSIHILFVCTGNTCRSQMAHAMAEALVKHYNWPVCCASAGIRTTPNMPTTAEALAVLSEQGISWQGHSQQLTAEMLMAAQVVWVMTEEHKAFANDLLLDVPIAQRPQLALLADTEVPDPLGKGLDAYAALFRFLQVLLPQRLSALVS